MIPCGEVEPGARWVARGHSIENFSGAKRCAVRACQAILALAELEASHTWKLLDSLADQRYRLLHSGP